MTTQNRTDDQSTDATPNEPKLVPADVVDKLVATFTDAVGKAAKAPPPVAAQPAAPVKATPTPAEREAEAKRKYAEARTRAQEIAKDDPVAAFELLATTIQESAPRAEAQDVTTDPAYRSLREQARRLAALDERSRTLLERYRDEVDSVVATMPAPRQIASDAWEEALAVVRGRHYDELRAEERAAWEKEQSERPAPTYATPVAGAARNRTAQRTPAVTLSPDQLGIARSFGISPDRYAAQLSELGEPARDGSYRNIPLVPADSVPKPGEF